MLLFFRSNFFGHRCVASFLHVKHGVTFAEKISLIVWFLFYCCFIYLFVCIFRVKLIFILLLLFCRFLWVFFIVWSCVVFSVSNVISLLYSCKISRKMSFGKKVLFILFKIFCFCLFLLCLSSLKSSFSILFFLCCLFNKTKYKVKQIVKFVY